MFQTKEQGEKMPEKLLNEMEIINLPDKEFAAELKLLT